MNINFHDSFWDACIYLSSNIRGLLGKVLVVGVYSSDFSEKMTEAFLMSDRTKGICLQDGQAVS